MPRRHARRVRRVRPILLAGSLLLLFGLPLSSGAQSGALPSALLLDPWGEWRPLAPISDNVRTVLPELRLPDFLVRPAPHVGMASSAGLAAGLPGDVPAARSVFQATGANESGDYRRPLEPADRGEVALDAFGWRPLGARGAAIGALTLVRSASDRAGFATGFEPFGSSPFVVTDTSNPAIRETRAQLQGALGWQVHGWGLGGSAGLDIGDRRTDAARFPRFDRISAPALAASVARAVLNDHLVIGVQARWLGGAETISLVPQPGSGLVYPFDGYSDPDPRRVIGAPGYFRRISQRKLGYRGALGGQFASVRWTAFAERQDRTGDYWTELKESPPTDRWASDGWYLGADASWRSSAGRALLTFRARRSSLGSTATRADLQGDIFRSTESVLHVGGDARWRTSDTTWAIGVVGTTSHEVRTREDFIARRGTKVDAWTPAGGLEVAYGAARATSVSASIGFTLRGAVSKIPAPQVLGPVYRAVLAPETSLYAAGSSGSTGAVTVARRFAPGVRVWLRAGVLSVSPQGATLPSLPSGDRRRMSIALGAIL